VSRRDCWDGHTYRYIRPPPMPRYRHVNHRLHCALTVLTAGVWGVLVWWWLPRWVASSNRERRLDYARHLAIYESLQAARRRRAPAPSDPERTMPIPAYPRTPPPA
jgi:hypothetical protein